MEIRILLRNKKKLRHSVTLRQDLVFVITFRGELSPGPKNGLERRPLRFSTICAKNQVLKINIEKVTVILRRKCHYWRTPPVRPYSCSTRVLSKFTHQYMYLGTQPSRVQQPICKSRNNMGFKKYSCVSTRVHTQLYLYSSNFTKFSTLATTNYLLRPLPR